MVLEIIVMSTPTTTAQLSLPDVAFALFRIVVEPSSLVLCASAALTIYYGAARAVEYERSLSDRINNDNDDNEREVR